MPNGQSQPWRPKTRPTNRLAANYLIAKTAPRAKSSVRSRAASASFTAMQKRPRVVQIWPQAAARSPRTRRVIRTSIPRASSRWGKPFAKANSLKASWKTATPRLKTKRRSTSGSPRRTSSRVRRWQTTWKTAACTARRFLKCALTGIRPCASSTAFRIAPRAGAMSESIAVSEPNPRPLAKDSRQAKDVPKSSAHASKTDPTGARPSVSSTTAAKSNRSIRATPNSLSQAMRSRG